MENAERDLGTKLDWVAVDHWNTDNPHIHVLLRGRLAHHGKDLVISRDYISRGFRLRAGELVPAWSLGRAANRKSNRAWRWRSSAERWTGLDRALRNAADDNGGVADLRPGAQDDDPELLPAPQLAGPPSSNGWASPNRSRPANGL